MTDPADVGIASLVVLPIVGCIASLPSEHHDGGHHGPCRANDDGATSPAVSTGISGVDERGEKPRAICDAVAFQRPRSGDPGRARDSRLVTSSRWGVAGR